MWTQSPPAKSPKECPCGTTPLMCTEHHSCCQVMSHSCLRPHAQIEHAHVFFDIYLTPFSRTSFRSRQTLVILFFKIEDANACPFLDCALPGFFFGIFTINLFIKLHDMQIFPIGASAGEADERAFHTRTDFFTSHNRRMDCGTRWTSRCLGV